MKLHLLVQFSIHLFQNLYINQKHLHSLVWLIEEDTDEDADDDSEEEEEEEENDFVNVGDDHDDYLFKI